MPVLKIAFTAFISGIAVCFVWVVPSDACTLFEDPRNFNTQTFVLQYPDEPPVDTQPPEANISETEAEATDSELPYGIPLEPLSREPDRIIFIGNQPNRPFQVVVTDSRRSTLLELRTCILDAFLTQTRLGRYIQVGSFTNRSEAEAIHRRLQRAGYPARVIHLR